MSIVKSPALVLKRWDLRETSLLVNFFTRDFGKITGELKGIRADPRKFASNVEIFSLNDIVFYQSRQSSVHLVSQCDMVDGFAAIKQSIAAITAASVVVELLDAVMQPEDVHPQLFDLAVAVLKELCGGQNPEKIATIFKIKALSLSGFKPHLDSCVSCNSSVMSAAKFSLSLGGLLCPRCMPKDLKARSIFKGTVATILHIERNEFKKTLSIGMNPQIKKELELVLNAFLHFHLGKELKSQKLIDKLATV